MSDNKEKEEDKGIELPVIGRPQMIMNDATGMCWIGLPLEKMAKLDAIVNLDSAKAPVLNYYKQRELRTRIQKPGMFDRPINGLKNFLKGK